MKFKTTLEPTSSLIDLTPLVDVVFLMLIFFLITSDILPLKSLNIEPPALNVEAPPRTTQILVVMDAQNVIYVGNKKEIVSLDSFFEQLSSELQRNRLNHPGGDTTVVLSVDKRVEYGDFLKVFAAIQQTNAKIRLVFTEEHLCLH